MNPIPILVWVTFLVLAVAVSPAWWWAVGIWAVVVMVASYR